MSAVTKSTLLVWAGFGLALGVVFIVVAVHGGGFAVVPAVDPGIKVWDASDGRKEP